MNLSQFSISSSRFHPIDGANQFFSSTFSTAFVLSPALHVDLPESRFPLHSTYRKCYDRHGESQASQLPGRFLLAFSELMLFPYRYVGLGENTVTGDRLKLR